MRIKCWLRNFLRLSQIFKFVVACLLMTYFVKCDSIKTSQMCLPAEEGQTYILTFNLTNVNQNLSIQCNEYAIASCYIPSHCKDVFEDFTTTFIFNNKSREVSLTVTFLIASREKERYWYVADNQVLTGCYVNMFARAKNIHCKEDINDDVLSLFCWTAMIYPQAKCSISVTSEMKRVIVNTMMICKNEVLQDDPKYYAPNCSLTLPLKDLAPVKYNVIINMFPNVTNSDMDLNFGINHVLTVNLEYPRVALNDCPKIVIEYTNVTCLCERSNSSEIHTSISWFGDKNSQIAPTSRPEVLTFDAIRTNASQSIGFYCGVFNSFGWKNSTVWYSPRIISKVLKFNCTQQKQDDTFIFTCKTEKNYPSALCYFNCNQSKQVILTDKLSYDHEIISDDPTYFTSTCSINIPKEYIRMGECQLTVTVYPNVTGEDTDKQFGNTETLSITIDDGEALFHSPETTILLCVVCGSVSICFIAILAWCCKNRGNVNVNDNYDEINVEYISADRMRYQGDDKYNSEGYRQMETSLPENIPEDILNKDNQYETIRD